MVRSIHAYIRLAVVAVVFTGSAVLLGTYGWPQGDRTIEFAAVVLTVILTSALATAPLFAEDRGLAAPHFVVDFATLLFLGGNAALIAAAAGIATRCAADFERAGPLRRLLLNAASALIAIEAAALAYVAIGDLLGDATWPWRAAPIAAAVVAYCLGKTLVADLVAPIVSKQPINKEWARTLLEIAPHYFVGATLAAGAAEIVDRGMWGLVPVAAVPLYCVYRAYAADMNRLEDEYRRREVIGSVNLGMSVVDRDGRVTFWNDELARIVNCARDRAIGRPLAGAVPALAQTPLSRAVEDALTTGQALTVAPLTLSSPSSRVRILEVRLLPVSDGVTMLWQDISERAHADYALKRSEERLALAAEGANDGLWEIDLRTQAFYISGRWKAMLGLPPSGGIGNPQEWLERVHPDDVASLRDALDAHFAGKTSHFEHEHRIRHEDGSYRWVLCRGVAARGAGQRPVRIAGSLTDTTAQATAQEQLRTAEFRDPLTGLCNRAVFVERLGRRLAEFKRQKFGDSFAALYLDLDRFKVVNDSLGHHVGDELLTAVARRLESCLRQDDAIARLGGDEFAILLNSIGDAQQANAIAFRIQKSFIDPFSIGGREVFTSASIGIAVGFAHYNNPDEVMRDADTAMYHAKNRGKARHELFDADMHARTRDRLGLENDLRHAIDNNDFEVHYQPIVLLASRKCVGFESLIRWTRNGEAVSPATFIPMAEELGLIEPLGTWVLQQACRTFAEWKRQYGACGIDYITVNVSSRQLMQQNFLLLVEQAVQASRLKPCDLRLEITETALMDSPTTAAKLLNELRDFGVKIYLDDFGTGYSSLSHLARLPVDALKIDRSFVRSLDLGSDRPAIVESILALARTLNTSVVAEGIESDDQARELERLGCTHAQGYLFSRPISSSAAEQVLATNQPLGPKRVQQIFESADPVAV
ncbi:MAG TPA: EAL domain-containing protein [Vicinamibacterales bacterium]|nr:EAL domain-containing protein [Vicinamibacterales bacterium]